MKPDEIKALRKRMGLSQEKFAAEIGVSTHTAHFWEHGKCVPSQLSLRNLRAYAWKNKEPISDNEDKIEGENNGKMS